MKLLALDASAKVATAALYESGMLRGEVSLNDTLTHSETMMPMIDTLLHWASVDVTELDFIACAQGPGSFTGLRIGAATAKGLAHGLGIPIIPVPTLDALAYNLGENPRLICPMMDARRQQVYTAAYAWERGTFRQLVPQAARRVEEMIQICRASGRETVFLGDGVPVYQDLLEREERFYLAPPNCMYQRAASVGALGLELLAMGQTAPAAEFQPIYLRKPQAERELEERQKRGERP